jgi:hypothetical protein
MWGPLVRAQTDMTGDQHVAICTFRYANPVVYAASG